MISTGEIKRGITVEIDGDLYKILDHHHIKMGRGSAQSRLKLRNLNTGATTEKTFQAGEKFKRAVMEKRTIQYLYQEDGVYHFMDTETFEQTPLGRDVLGDAANYLTDNQTLELLTYQDKPIDVELPPVVEMTVTKADPGLRGDTATAGTKPATLETGLVVQVPLFVNEGDRIRVDTRTGQYVERA
ncbi:MAG TPA: elongation factor P [Chloroflexota bacterium]|nr:elongation factor P [Chloroflexota bacterium]